MDFYLTTEYQNWLAEIKRRIAASRVRAAISANSELIRLYYDLGAQIVARELTAKWGSAFIDSFSRDLKKAFPEMTGFSPQNLRYCRAFYRFYRADEICQQSVGELSDEVGDVIHRSPIRSRDYRTARSCRLNLVCQKK